MTLFKEFTKGFIKENPVFVMALGLCPTLAVTSSVVNAIGMGLAATFVLVFSNIFISLIKNLIPSKIRIPAFIVVIASFVTIVDMVMHAYLPAIHKSLGLFIPLIVVNCIILGRAEAFASKNNVFRSILDGLGMGLGFTLALVVISGIREVLGAGQFLGYNVFSAEYTPFIKMKIPFLHYLIKAKEEIIFAISTKGLTPPFYTLNKIKNTMEFQPMLVAILAPGAFIVMGLLMSLMNLSKKRKN